MSQKLCTRVSTICLILAITCAVDILIENSGNDIGPRTTVIGPEDLGVLKVGPSFHTITLHVHNPTDEARNIIGMNENCGGLLCITMQNRVATPLPPQSTIDVVVELEVRQPGDANYLINLFVENGKNRFETIEHPIKWIGVE